MKKLLNVLAIAAVFLLNACEKSPLTKYESGNTIYFTSARTVNESNAVDSVFFSFFYEKADTMIIAIPVSVAGMAQPFDRPYALEIDPDSRSMIGKEIFLGEQRVRANRLSDTLYVKLARTERLKNTLMLLTMKLLPNEHFQTNFPDRQLSSVARKVPFHSFRIFMNDFASRPDRWLDAYLGPFSGKKAQLMTDLFGFDFEHDWVPPYGPTSAVTYILAGAYAMQRYLNEMDAAGTPVLEEDGSKMIMGTYVQ